jgi:uncharacterized membrane protein YczE
MLIDSAFAVAIVCLGMAAAAFAFSAMAHRGSNNLDGLILALSERGKHEIQAFQEER